MNAALMEEVKAWIADDPDPVTAAHLQGLLDAKDMTITKRDARITELESKLSAYKKIVWVFGILLLIALNIFRLY